MRVEDEMLMALADGELDAETSAQLRRQIAADPALKADYALFVQTAAALRADPGLGPVPERLIRQIEDWPVSQAAPQPAPLWQRAWRPVALAASLALAVWAGGRLAPGAEGGFRPLDYATLPTGESRSLAGGEVRALASYDTEAGFCRHLRHRDAQQAQDVLLCKAEGGWSTRLSLNTPLTEGEFVPASSLAAGVFDAALNELGAADPLSPEAERDRLAGAGG